MKEINRRLRRLEHVNAAADVDPRMIGGLWPGPDRAVVLALVDFVNERADDFAIYNGSASSPGFANLPDEARDLLGDLYALWGASRRFPHIVASFVDAGGNVAPLWAIRALVTRATMRRRFPGALARFARDGDPTYTSHATYRADRWPERSTWTADERAYIGRRFHTWDQSRRRAAGLPHA